ncbi:MAG: hypothetical protein R3E03_02345 [Novosphingobium sp.]
MSMRRWRRWPGAGWWRNGSPGFNHAASGVIVAPDGSRVAWLRDPDSNLLSVVELAAPG